jgi:thymidylate synthase
MREFKTVTGAFEFFYDKIDSTKEGHNGTKAIYDQVFRITNTKEKIVKTKWRKFKESYAKVEWDWYLSQDRSAKEIAKVASIWNNHMDENGNVNSNYGWQWGRNDQLEYVIRELQMDRYSRRALITIYDAKEHQEYSKDTPCTLNVQFYFKPNSEKLHMTVIMRSNDLWFGFCNDAYCFLNLHKMVCERLEVEQGFYTHFAQNLHLYKRHFDKKS